MMIAIIIGIAQVTNAMPPKIGVEAADGTYFVIVGGKRRPADFRERRQMKSPEEPPQHPRGLYQILRTEMTGDFGAVHGHKIVDAGGKRVADLRWLLGDFQEIANVRAEVIGWGHGNHSAIVQRSGGSPSAGGSTQYVSLDLKSKAREKRVIFNAGAGLGLVVGYGASPTVRYSREGAEDPPLYRLVRNKPVRLTRKGGPLSASPASVAPGGRWALAWFGEGSLLIDLATGKVSDLPGGNPRFLR